jgi:hypothetical protein
MSSGRVRPNDGVVLAPPHQGRKVVLNDPDL